jgi:hypothetical protein
MAMLSRRQKKVSYVLSRAVHYTVNRAALVHLMRVAIKALHIWQRPVV